MFREQQWKLKEDGIYPDRKGQPSTPKSYDTSEIEVSTPPCLPERNLFNSLQEDVYRIQSPRWLDDQLEAAWDHKRPWRSSPNGPPTPTHDPSFRVPIYSPGDKKPTKMVLPEYLIRRRNALNQIKKTQREAEEAQPDIEQSPVEKELCHTGPGGESFKSGGNQPESGPEDKGHRTSVDFSSYFKERNRSLGLEGQDYFSMSEVKKQVIMFNYGTRAMKDRQAELNFEEREENGSVGIEDSTESWKSALNTEELKFHEKRDAVRRLIQHWQNDSAKIPREKRESYIEKTVNAITADSEDPFSLDNASSTANETISKLDTSEDDTNDTFVRQEALSGAEKRQTKAHALWFFPKPKLPGAETETSGNILKNNHASCNRPGTGGITRGNKENHIIRRALSFPVKVSNTAHVHFKQESLHPDDDALISQFTAWAPPRQEADNPHLSAQLDLASPRRSVVSDKPSSARFSSFPSALTDPTSNLSLRTIKALSAMPQLLSFSGDKKRPSSSSNLQQCRASVPDIKTLVNTSAGNSCHPARGLVQPFFDWEKASSNSMTLRKVVEGDASEMLGVSLSSPVAENSGGEASFSAQETSKRSAGESILPPTYLIKFPDWNHRYLQGARLSCRAWWVE